MILGIICFIIFILSFVGFVYYSDDYNFFGMILCCILMIISGLGIITFICMNAEIIVNWFKL